MICRDAGNVSPSPSGERAGVRENASHPLDGLASLVISTTQPKAAAKSSTLNSSPRSAWGAWSVHAAHRQRRTDAGIGNGGHCADMCHKVAPRLTFLAGTSGTNVPHFSRIPRVPSRSSRRTSHNCASISGVAGRRRKFVERLVASSPSSPVRFPRSVPSACCFSASVSIKNWLNCSAILCASGLGGHALFVDSHMREVMQRPVAVQKFLLQRRRQQVPLCQPRFHEIRVVLPAFCARCALSARGCLARCGTAG